MKTKVEKINDQIKKLPDTNPISDGYHTFGELYAHRIEIFIALCRVLNWDSRYTGSVWRNKVDDDWFILGLGDKPGEQISYHIPMDKWGECGFAMHKVPAWDGHTSEDVLVRLRAL